jgi:hypothetical protein
MSKRERYQHSVIDVCMCLHGCDTGSGDGIPDDERAELVEWLRWRIDNWARPLGRADKIRLRVDNAVRALAIAVLKQADYKDAERLHRGGSK